jgi:phenylalanyl-tRNA synthetase beta chain
MKISANWLRQYLSHSPSPEEISPLLTDCGLEVESLEEFESVKGGLKGIVVGEVKDCQQHPNADRLSLTKVDIGSGDLLSIVCGAPNVATGQKVLVATIGATLFPVSGESFQIKESKIRGELSQGMLCAEDEIGTGKSHDGILVLPSDTKIGTPAAEIFNVSSDQVFEIGLTPNRIDAASHFGVARDLSAVLYEQGDLELLKPQVKSSFTSEGHDVEVSVETSDAVIRYSSIRISNVKVAESPAWLKNALLSIGLRPINNLVDITNYILHETGQPLHAFDANKISGKKIHVKTCAPGTLFKALDGSEHKLTEQDLMICDAQGPLCLAGIYGGLDSGVTEATTEVFLECATFHPVWVRKSSRNHNLKTDSSFRFERGTDPEATIYTLQRAADLIVELAGGKLHAGLTDHYHQQVLPVSLFYRWAEMDRLVGEAIPREAAKKILERLQIHVSSETSEGVQLEIPTFKVGVEGSADVTEEILRIYGYNRIAIPAQVRNSVAPAPKPDPVQLRNRISDHLCGIGFMEALNNSLSPSELASFTTEGVDQAVKLANPLSSELDILRMSMIPALLENIAWNKNRQQSDLQFFEWGKVYFKQAEGFIEKQRLALFVYGNDKPLHWQADSEKTSFYHLKGVVQHVLQLCGLELNQLTGLMTEDPAYQQAWSIKKGEKELVKMGSIHPMLLKRFDIVGPVWFAEFNWELMLKSYGGSKIQYREVSKFPSVRRDLALLIDQSVQYNQIEKIAFSTEKKLLREVNLFDVYQGDKLPEGKKSYAVSFLFRDEEQTLTDKHIEKSMERLVKALVEQLGAELR